MVIDQTIIRRDDLTCCGKVFQTRRQYSGHVIGKHIRKIGAKNVSIKLSEMSPHQEGYLAAFLDGEGGIQISRTTRKNRQYTLSLHPTVYFTNTNQLVIDTIRNWLEVKSKIIQVDRRAGKKIVYRVHITGVRNIRALLEVLLPLLIVKRLQAETMLRYCVSRLSHYRGDTREFTREEIGLRDTIVALNKRGTDDGEGI